MIYGRHLKIFLALKHNNKRLKHQRQTFNFTNKIKQQDLVALWSKFMNLLISQGISNVFRILIFIKNLIMRNHSKNCFKFNMNIRSFCSNTNIKPDPTSKKSSISVGLMYLKTFLIKTLLILVIEKQV